MRRKANAPSNGEPVNRQRQPRAKTLELRKLFGTMPPYYHWPDPSRPFDLGKSEVIRWLMEHPQAGRILFNAARSAAAIIYDPTTRRWRGCNRRLNDAR